jgi:putative chitinase
MLFKKYKTLFNKYKVNTPLRIAHFMGQIEHESNLQPKHENLNYSYNQLIKIFKSDFDLNKDRVLSEIEKKTAQLLANKPKDIANFVYANQGGNGNVNSEDGWKYRGRGFIQVTLKDNYRELSKYTGIDFLNNPDLLLNEANSVIAALWYWDKHKLNILADKDNVNLITKKINGGYNGLSHRIALVNKWKKILKV